jgi:hypothetical protein
LPSDLPGLGYPLGMPIVNNGGLGSGVMDPRYVNSSTESPANIGAVNDMSTASQPHLYTMHQQPLTVHQQTLRAPQQIQQYAEETTIHRSQSNPYSSSPMVDSGSPSDNIDMDMPSDIADRETFLRIADNLITPRESMFSQRSSGISPRSSSVNVGDVFSAAMMDSNGNLSTNIDLYLASGGVLANLDNSSRFRIDSQDMVTFGIEGSALSGLENGISSHKIGTRINSNDSDRLNLTSGVRFNRANSTELAALTQTRDSRERAFTNRSSGVSMSGMSGYIGHTFSSLSSASNGINGRMSTMSTYDSVGKHSSVESFDHFLANNVLDLDRNSFQVQDRDYSIISTASLGGDLDCLTQDPASLTLMEGLLPDDLETNPLNYDSDDSEQSELNMSL